MTQQHPITPPSELVEDLTKMALTPNGLIDFNKLTALAARWGADQELDACVEWVVNTRAYDMTPGCLRAARRPNSPSLKKQALAKLPEQPENMASHLKLTPGDVATIRRALEQLKND